MRPPAPCQGCECRSAECHSKCLAYKNYQYIQNNYLRDLQKGQQTERDLSGTRKHRNSSTKKKGAARRKG